MIIASDCSKSMMTDDMECALLSSDMLSCSMLYCMVLYHIIQYDIIPCVVVL